MTFTSKKTAKLITELKALRFGGLGPAPDYDFIENAVAAQVFERDGTISVGNDDGHGLIDYYGEFRGGYPYIDPKLVAFAKKRGMYWEWNDPGSIALTE